MATGAADTISASAVYRPSPPLRGLVSGIGYEQRGFPPGVHRGLPSPAITFVIPLETALVLDDGGGPEAMSTCVGGLNDAPVEICHDGTQVGMHLSLTPLGVRRLLGRPAGELAGMNVSVDELWGRADAAELSERLAGSGAWAEQFAVLDDILLRRLHAAERDAAAPADELAEAWKVLTEDVGVTVAGVAAHVGWSRRHLAARFRAEFGLRPKTLERLVRFARARHLLQGDDRPTLATVAAETGYADQAHMTRAWKRFAGCSPSAWLAEEVLPFVQDGAAGDRAESVA